MLTDLLSPSTIWRTTQMNRNKIFAASLISLAILLFCTNPVAVHAQVPIKVAILPVKIHAPEKMDYLQGGLMDMLESHIGGKEGVEILDRSLVTKTFDKFKKDLNETTARSLAQDLGADYLVAGSVTFFGTGGSIDFQVFAKDPSKETFTTYKIIKDMNNLLPDFSLLADEISAKAFGARPQVVGAAPEPQARQPEIGMAVPPPTSKTPPLQQQARPQAPPAAISAATAVTQPKVASINQELIEENESPPPIETRPQEVVGPVLAPQPEPWKSQKLNHALFSMDVGDIFGDGSRELVAMRDSSSLQYIPEPKTTVSSGCLWPISTGTAGTRSMSPVRKQERNSRPGSHLLSWSGMGKNFPSCSKSPTTTSGWFDCPANLQSSWDKNAPKTAIFCRRFTI
jgi:hypothetical protein